MRMSEGHGLEASASNQRITPLQPTAYCFTIAIMTLGLAVACSEETPTVTDGSANAGLVDLSTDVGQTNHVTGGTNHTAGQSERGSPMDDANGSTAPGGADDEANSDPPDSNPMSNSDVQAQNQEIPIDADDGRPLLEPEFVMNEIELLPSSDGFDLTDDGMANNGLALLFEDPVVGPVLGGDPNEFIARSVRRGDLLLLLDFSQLNSFVDDALSRLELYLGRDTDGRRRNNFSGEETFTVTCSSLDQNGDAESRFDAIRLESGNLNGRGGQFRFLVTFGNTEVLLQNARIEARLEANGTTLGDGLLGGAVSFRDLEQVVLNDPEIGPGFAPIMINFLRTRLDVDLDLDGTADALSASFRFSAVRANVDRESPCED